MPQAFYARKYTQMWMKLLLYQFFENRGEIRFRVKFTFVPITFLVCSSFNPILKLTRISPWRSPDKQSKRVVARKEWDQPGILLEYLRVRTTFSPTFSRLSLRLLRTSPISILAVRYLTIFPDLLLDWSAVNNVSHGECIIIIIHFFTRARDFILHCFMWNLLKLWRKRRKRNVFFLHFKIH